MVTVGLAWLTMVGSEVVWVVEAQEMERMPANVPTAPRNFAPTAALMVALIKEAVDNTIHMSGFQLKTDS